LHFRRSSAHPQCAWRNHHDVLVSYCVEALLLLLLLLLLLPASVAGLH
jgi:hypothetical protein